VGTGVGTSLSSKKELTGIGGGERSILLGVIVYEYNYYFTIKIYFLLF